ncbi:MAG TPA: ATP-binding protein [Bacteroidia bacterium]|nr:ATP-binding protein [Bacteroidia bacterium]
MKPLQQDDDLFRMLVERVKDYAIFMVDTTGYVTSWNEGAENIKGYTADEIIGKHISVFYTEEDIKSGEPELHLKTAKEKGRFENEGWRARKDGSRFWEEAIFTALYNTEGKFKGYSKITRDLTERKRAEEKLRDANKELAFQNEVKEKRAAELIIANKELAFQNEEKEKRAAELIIANKELTFQNEEKEKRAAELIIANKELAFQNTEKEKRASELIIANKELAFQNIEKEKRAGELTSANGKLKKGEDAIRKLNKELEVNLTQIIDVNQELEAFSYSVSHDLRAPLRAINGYAQMLEEDYGKSLNAEGVRKLGVIMENAKKMGLLIDDLLTFSRLGRKQVQKSPINMNKLVESVLIEISKTIQYKTTLKITELKPASGDYSLLYQVMMNLISNALKYSSKVETPLIELASEDNGEEIIYSIKDNGAGFDMRYVDKLFNVFQRLHTTAEFEGTGVGLAIVQRIIKKHGGKVWAKGEINKGAEFYFSLPKK